MNYIAITDLPKQNVTESEGEIIPKMVMTIWRGKQEPLASDSKKEFQDDQEEKRSLQGEHNVKGKRCLNLISIDDATNIIDWDSAFF